MKKLLNGIVIKDFKLFRMSGIALFPFIFVRTDTWKWVRRSNVLLNHERIHLHQQVEMLVLPFYIWYLIEYIFRLIQYKGSHTTAYRNISFEREAFDQESDLEYLKTRSRFSWVKYLSK